MRIDGNSVTQLLRTGYKPSVGAGKSKDSESSPSANVVADVNLSPLGKGMAKAMRSLDEQTPRPEAVERGKDIVKNWQEPTDEQVDKIMSSLASEV